MSLAGVAFLDHTADVGMDVEAASLEQLLHRCALGMLALLRGEEEGGEGQGRGQGQGQGQGQGRGQGQGQGQGRGQGQGEGGVAIEVRADDPVGLLAGWLRELLFLHEVRAADYVALDVDHLDRNRLAGTLMTRSGGRAVREIKGVTYHGLAVMEEGGRWRARVIFDV